MRTLSIVTAASIALLFPGHALAQSQFTGRVPYFAGPMPQIAALADLNRDGNLDLIIADNAFSPNPGFISVLLGNGDGTFQKATSYPAGPNPYSIAVGDFNHDGNADIAVVNDAPSGTVSIFLGKGDGTLGTSQTFAVGSLPVCVAAVDLNGDGNLDLVVANFGGNVSVLMGNGDGTFQTAVSYAAGSRPMSLVIADFNLDGKLDLAVADEFFPNVSVLLGNGDGTFQTAKSYNAGGNSISIAAADFNGDGKPDLAVANNIFGNGTVSVLLGKGDGTFQAPVDYLAGSSTQSVVAGDFNGDGNIDLAVANFSDQTVSLLHGNGDGTFAAPVNYQAGLTPVGLTAAGLRSPQLLDLVVTNFQTNTVSVLLNTGAGGLGFSVQTVGTTSASQPVTLSNPGVETLNLGGIFMAGSFSGDFTINSNCGNSLAPGASCIINVAFNPSGTGPRTALLEIFDNTGAIIETILLRGTGKGSCTDISDCAYQLLNQRVVANQNAFFIYKDADSGFNHGLPTLFGSIDLTTVNIKEDCVDSGLPLTDCSSDPNAIDASRGTVLHVTFPPLPLQENFVGMNIQEPQNFDGQSIIGNSYDLTPATALQLDVRSPSPGGAMVQFGVGGCVTNFMQIGQTWTTITIQLNSLFPPPGNFTAQCPPDLTNMHILFSIAMSGVNSPAGGTILLDNIQFMPVPQRQSSSPLALSLPLSTQTFGVVVPPGTTVAPSDQANRNVAAIYEAALTILSLLKRGHLSDIANALEIANALDYALHHDNHGGPIPPASDGSGGLGLHNAYSAGDIALVNDQSPPGGGKAGDVRLAGFSGLPTECMGHSFCEVLSGATGGNNAWAIFALAAAYLQSGNTIYLNDAETIGKWIIGSLMDRTNDIPFPPACLSNAPNLNAPGYGGYFLGYDDGTLNFVCGKSTENNADIFAAFNLLAQIETARGNISAAQQWTAAANVAGNFVIQMFDSANGRFFSGTVTAVAAAKPGSGSCPAISTLKGNDVINQCDFLDANSFIALAMAGSQALGVGLAQPPLDWNAPNHYVLGLGNTIPDPPNNLNPPNNSGTPASFTQTVTEGPTTFQGFDLIPAIPATGVAWEFTGQMAETCSFLDIIQNSTTFHNCTSAYVSQIGQAQNSAPFGDGLGLVAAVLQNGASFPPAGQCILTPFQCIPERVGLAATNWAIFGQQQFNPMAYSASNMVPAMVNFPGQLIGTTATAQTTTLTNLGTLPMAVNSLAINGGNASEFMEADNCAGSILALGKSCTINITFTPAAEGERDAVLLVSENGLGSRQISLSGTGVPANNFSIAVTPDSVTTIAGDSATFNLTTTTTAGSSQTVTLSATGLPSGVTATFNPPSIISGQPAALMVSTSVSSSPKPITFMITGTGSSAISSTTAILTIQSPVAISSSAVNFPVQQLGTTSATQQLSVTNNGSSLLNLMVQLAGRFYGDFQVSGCIGNLAAGTSCTLTIAFSPTGTGLRSASIVLLDSAGNSPQTIPLTGTGVGLCLTIRDCAYSELNQIVSTNQHDFFVFKDADSAFNHGFPALIGNTDLFPAITIDPGCINDPASNTGCSTDLTTFDSTRGTVFRVTFPPIPGKEFAGVNFEEPQNFDGTHGNSYNLTGATAVQFDARSPSNISVRFGVGGCVSSFTFITSSWSTVVIPIQSLVPPPGIAAICPPDLTQTHILFSVAVDDVHGANGGTVLLDNIQFPDVRDQQLSLPLSTQTFGAVPKQLFPIPIDEAVRNLSTVEEASLTVATLLRRGNKADLTNAIQVLNALDYALHHDSHGDLLPVPPDNSLGLHSAYEAGDLPLLNDQITSPGGKSGDVRLAGFFAGTGLCGKSGFCLVSDGAFGGPNAWAMLAFETGYLRLGNPVYLQDAETIGTWIIDTLADSNPVGFGGYFVGFSDGGLPKVLTLAKSTEFNADIFAALNLLAQIETSSGNMSKSKLFAAKAKNAGQFVANMFDLRSGRFFAGTIPIAFADNAQPGTCPDKSLAQGPDVINACDSLTQNSFPILALAGSRDFGIKAAGNLIDWTLPLLHIENNFAQSVTANGISFKGFNLNPNTGGIAWESTAETVASCSFLDAILKRTDFEDCQETYLPQIMQAQNQAPFGDGTGVVAATLENGEALEVVRQCIATPFQCIPERIGLGSTAWATLADQGFNPMAFSVHALSSSNIDFGGELLQASNVRTLILTNTGTAPLSLLNPLSISGVNSSDFTEADDCLGILIAPQGSCHINLKFMPTAIGSRTATLNLVDNALVGGQALPLVGTGQDIDIKSNPPSVDVNAGQTAIYNLTFAPLGGFSQSLQLSCIEPPSLTLSTCIPDSTTITLDGTNNIQVTIKVTTTGAAGKSEARRFPNRFSPLTLLGVVFGMIVLMSLIAFASRSGWRCKRARWAIIGLLAVVLSSGCGGRNSTSTPNPTPTPSPTTAASTPAGKYDLMVNATVGDSTRTIHLTLNVH